MNELKEINVGVMERVKAKILLELSQPGCHLLLEFLEEESGQDSMEYALLAALLSLSAVATLKNLAAEIILLWQHMLTNFVAAV